MFTLVYAINGCHENSVEFVNIHKLGVKFYDGKPQKRQIFVQLGMYCGLWKVCYSQVPNKRPPRLLIFVKPPDLIKTLRLLTLKKLNLLRVCYVISFLC